MQQKYTLLLLVMFSLNYSASAQVPSDEVLKSIVASETTTFNAKDSAAWEAMWLHDPTVTITLIFAGMNFSWTGWDSIRPIALREMRGITGTASFTNSDYVIRKDANLATLDYKETMKRQTDDSMKTYISQEQRVLAKVKGKWKIVSMVSRSLEPTDSPSSIENSINMAGYNLLSAGRTTDAIKLFKLNTEFFPKAWNTFDSLGEGYLIAGDKEQAKLNYEKSIQLNPKNSNGKKALEKL